MQREEHIVKVISNVPFDSIPSEELLEFPKEPPVEDQRLPDIVPRRQFLGEEQTPAIEYEVCLICGDQVIKGTMDKHIASCLADI